MAYAFTGAVNAPDFPPGLDWLNTDHPLSLRQFRGKVVVLDFWTYCCINCMHVIPDLKKLEAKYPNELVVIGVHSAKFATERGTDNIREAILRYEITHPVVNDRDLKIWNAYAVNAWPSIIVIDPDGKAVARHSGEGVFEPVDAFVSKLIAQFDRQHKIDRTPVHFRLEKDKAPPTLLSFPGKIAIDPAAGNAVISDSNHNRILIVSLKDGEIRETIGDGTAGLRDGSFSEARFFRPQGVALDGPFIYVADTENHAIRRIDLRDRKVTTLAGTGKQAQMFHAGGPGRTTELNSPWDLLVHNGRLYIAMAGFHQLWTLDLNNLEVRPYAGSGRENIVDGPRARAALAQPSGITTDGQRLFFADSEVSAVRTVDLPPGGLVRTIVGAGLFDFGDRDGPVAQARFQHPLGVVYHDGAIFVADTYNSRIRRIDLGAGTVTTIAGTERAGFRDGPADQAQFNEPSGLTWYNGRLYITDTNNHLVRVLDPATRTVSTLAIRQPRKMAEQTGKSDRFAGELVRLPAQQVASGAGSLEISFAPPPGFKLNSGSPIYVAVSPRDEKVASFAKDVAEQNLENPSLPIKVPATFSPGATTLTADLVVYFCREGENGICTAQQLRVELPVEVKDAQASHTAKIDVQVKEAAMPEPAAALQGAAP